MRSVFLIIIISTLIFHQSTALGQNISYYSIDAEIFPEQHLLVSQTSLILKNLSDSTLKEIELKLSFDKINYIKNSNGDILNYNPIPGGIRIQTEINAKDSIQVNLSYEGKFQGGTSASIGLFNSWLLFESHYYPQTIENAILPYRFTYDLKVKVPDSLTVISSGRLVSKSEISDKIIFNYKVDFPVSIISISAAKYKLSSFNSDGTTILTYLYPEDEYLKDTLISSFGKVFEYYKEKFGNYPFDDFKIVETDRRGGYSPAGLILLNKASILKLDFFTQFLLYHELAHQWWGNIVNPNKDGLLLSETMATYSALDYWKHIGIINPVVIKSFKLPFPFSVLDIQPDITLDFYIRNNHHLYETHTIAEADIYNGDEKPGLTIINLCAL